MRGVRGAAGWALVGWAVLLERTVAGKAAVVRLKRARNAALRAAHRRGVPAETLAARLGLSEAWMRRVVTGRPVPPSTMDL
ncbi:hypothetical protein ACWC10_24495 [Streptomyces sp. NPDC001595]|uniref:hypothetical protein n=1 Tax=Streptomyces sp. NPDC001532 TaxID=3154520 RepID=UPI00332E69A2